MSYLVYQWQVTANIPSTLKICTVKDADTLKYLRLRIKKKKKKNDEMTVTLSVQPRHMKKKFTFSAYVMQTEIRATEKFLWIEAVRLRLPRLPSPSDCLPVPRYRFFDFNEGGEPCFALE